MNWLKNRWSKPGGYHEVLVVAIPLILSTASWSVQHFVDRMFLAWYTRFVMFTSTVLSLLILVLPTYLVAVVFEYGLMASWIIATFYVSLVGIVFYIRFLNGKWQTMRVIEPSLSKTVYRLSFLMLNAMSVISLFTGFKISFLPYKLCPVIFTGASVLIILGCYL